MSSPDKPEPVKISLEPPLSPSFLLIKMLKFKLEPSAGLSENLAIIVFTGVSVQYIVYLTWSYKTEGSTKQLTNRSLNRVQPTVISGAIISMGSGVFLIAT